MFARSMVRRDPGAKLSLNELAWADGSSTQAFAITPNCCGAGEVRLAHINGLDRAEEGPRIL